jgi:hypothetical protein
VRAGKGKKDFWHEEPAASGVEQSGDSASTGGGKQREGSSCSV